MSENFSNLVLDIAQKSIVEPEYWERYMDEKDIQSVRAHNVHRPVVDGLFSPVAAPPEEAGGEPFNKDIYSNVKLMFEVLSNCHQNVPGWKVCDVATQYICTFTLMNIDFLMLLFSSHCISAGHSFRNLRHDRQCFTHHRWPH